MTTLDNIGVFAQIGANLNQDGPGGGSGGCPIDIGGPWSAGGAEFPTYNGFGRQMAMIGPYGDYDIVVAWVEPHYDTTYAWWTWVGPYVAGWDGSAWTVLGGTALETGLVSCPDQGTDPSPDWDVAPSFDPGDRFLPGQLALATDGTNLYVGYGVRVVVDVPTPLTGPTHYDPYVTVVKYWDGSSWTEIVEIPAQCCNNALSNAAGLIACGWGFILNADPSEVGVVYIFNGESGQDSLDNTDPDFYGPSSNWIAHAEIFKYQIDGTLDTTFEILNFFASGAATPPRPFDWGVLGYPGASFGRDSSNNLKCLIAGYINHGSSGPTVGLFVADVAAETFTDITATYGFGLGTMDPEADPYGNFVGANLNVGGYPRASLTQMNSEPDSGGNYTNVPIDDVGPFVLDVGIVFDGELVAPAPTAVRWDGTEDVWAALGSPNQNSDIAYVYTGIFVAGWVRPCGPNWTLQQTIPDFLITDTSYESVKAPVMYIDSAGSIAYVGALMAGGYIQVFSADIIRTAIPTDTTGIADGVTGTGATLHGELDFIDEIVGDSTWYFEYGLDDTYGFYSTGGTVTDGDGIDDVADILTGLSGGTTYHYRIALATPAGCIIYGDDMTFTTDTIPSISFEFST